MKKLLLLTFLFINIALFSETKAIWVPVWDLTDSLKIKEIVSLAKSNGINEILAEIRYRGDALYCPNKNSSTYKNTEKFCYVLKDTLFDPFDYLIKTAHKQHIDVQAWVTTFVVTSHNMKNIDKDHIIKQHPEWVTYDFENRKMKPNTLEGAYLDPGIPAVQKYLTDIFLDIVENYKPDGLQLDYVRYPDIIYGYNPLSWKRFVSQSKTNDGAEWIKWRQQQVTNFVKKLNKKIKVISPETKLTAAVIWKIKAARERFSQDWIDWITKDYVDKVYLMAYTKSNDEFEAITDTLSTFKLNKKIVVGLRAWDDAKKYKAQEIIQKIAFVRKKKFKGFALFSSTGLSQNNYWNPLKATLRK